MVNADLVKLFERIADLMEIDGADVFRINAYRRSARSVKNCAEDIATLASEKRLTELSGVGKGTAERIVTYLETGRIDVLDALSEKLPSGLPRLLDIPGLGPKKIALAHRELGVGGLEDLKKAVASGKLAELPGLGAASVKKIAEGIAFLETSGDRTPRGVALPIGESFAERIGALPGVTRVEIAGSLRRGLETIGDIDILCQAQDGAAIIKAFTEFEEVKRVLASGGTKGSVTVEIETDRALQIDLRVVAPASFGAALQYFTGSKEHNIRLRERAIKNKWRLNEYGLHDGEDRIAGETEADIYEQLGLPMIPPELREDRGEFDLKESPKLVTLDDIRSDLHMHTVASDGKNTIEEMARAALTRGYDYIAICDHSKSSTIANGLSVERMTQHIQAIRDANKQVRGITILVGTECDILPDGSLDYPDDLLAQCDWVVASVHAAMGKADKSKKLSPTERTIAAIENPNVCVIGHPTGRLIQRRAPMEIDMRQVIEAAARTGTFLEINANWMRLDLKDDHARQAIAAGVMLSINTDAHRTQGLDQLRHGIATARRAGAVKSDIANCLTLPALRKCVQKMREG